MEKEPLPQGIQFEFVNLKSPDRIEMQFAMNVYMGDENINGEPVSYILDISFDKDEKDHYVFSSVNLSDLHNIEPYDHMELEHLLEERLKQILEFCSFTAERTLGLQLNDFLSEYGDNSLLKFYL